MIFPARPVPLGESVLGYVHCSAAWETQVFATSTVTTIGWVLFILLISYFILADASVRRSFFMQRS
jgi:hypothetical protein